MTGAPYGVSPPTGVPGAGPGTPVPYGMPPGPMPPGGMPPTGAPAKKNRVALIATLALVLVLVVCGGGGFGVWFFAFKEPSDLAVYPVSYERVIDPAPAVMYTFDESADLCSLIEWSPVTSFMDFDSPLEATAEAESDGAGWYECRTTFRGENAYRSHAPVGAYSAFAVVLPDAASAQALFDDAVARDQDTASEMTIDGVGENVAAFDRVQGTAHEISMNAVNGNVYISGLLGYSAGEYFAAPDHQMMLNASADMMNSALTALQ